MADTPAVIEYDGIDITSRVIVTSANFVAAANGRPGACQFRVRDDEHEFELVQGRSITLDIAGVREWTGFVATVRRGFFFNGSEKAPAVLERYFDVVGVDLNILFHKRVLYDKVDPTEGLLTTYPAGTDDGTILTDYMTNHLDLSSDGLGTSLIENVGTPSTDVDIAGHAGWTWDQFMKFLTHATGAIYYIDPSGEVVLTDVDTPNAPYTITDHPAESSGGGGGGGAILFEDTFSRVVPVGIGDAVNYTDDFGSDEASVNGSELVFGGEGGTVQWQINFAPVPPWGEYQYDFWVPDTDDNYAPFYELDTDVVDLGGGVRYFTYLATNATDDGSTWELYAPISATGSFAYATFTPDRESWYTAKLRFDPDGVGGVTVSIKVWKRGSSEPDWMDSGVHAGNSGGWSPFLSVYSGYDPGDVGKVDNIIVRELTEGGGPPGDPEIGCRELEIDFAGEGLRNDVLAWGIGQGAREPVFARVEDEASIAAHGRWQIGRTSLAVWRQETVDRIADSYVYGSPQNKRGGKDDAVSVRCAVFEPGLRVGMKAVVRSDVYGYEDTLPIRRVAISFPAPESPRYDLVLGHEIDDPWSTHEFWFPDLSLPNIGIGQFDPPIWPPLPPLWPPYDPCGEAHYGGCESCTDLFNRTENPGWGTSEINGLSWSMVDVDGDPVSDNGSHVATGKGYLPGPAGSGSNFMQMAVAPDVPFETLELVEIRAPSGATGTGTGPHLSVQSRVIGEPETGWTPYWGWSLFVGDDQVGTEITIDATLGRPAAEGGNTFSSGTIVGPFYQSPTANPRLWIRRRGEPNAVRVKAWWSGTAEPVAWTVEITLAATADQPTSLRYFNSRFDGGVGEFWVHNLCFSEGLSCPPGGSAIGLIDWDVARCTQCDLWHTRAMSSGYGAGVGTSLANVGHNPIGSPLRCSTHDDALDVHKSLLKIADAQYDAAKAAGVMSLSSRAVGLPGLGNYQTKVFKNVSVPTANPGGPGVTDWVDVEPDWWADGELAGTVTWVETATPASDGRVVYEAGHLEIGSSDLTTQWIRHEAVAPDEANFYISDDWAGDDSIVALLLTGDSGISPCYGAVIPADSPVEGPSSEGGLEEIATPSGEDPTSTWFQTDHQYYAGSERVFLNGLLLRPGIDYLRHPVDRWIEVLSSVTISPGDVVSATYEIYLSTPAPELL